MIILGVLVSHGRKNHVHKSLNKAVHSYDYKKGLGLHKSDLSCGAVTDITSQSKFFPKYAQKPNSFKYSSDYLQA